MDTCVRGFSNTFMPDNKVEVTNLQVIEGGELERAWKSTRRQRLAQQEQTIWDQFVKEQDILKNVLKDDPYQFLEQLPAECLKELMETELQRMKQEDEEAEKEKDQKSQESTPPASLERSSAPAVTFALADVDSDIFHIFSDDKDSGEEAEDEVNESMETPHTVRELMSGGGAGVGGEADEGGDGGGDADGGGGGGDDSARPPEHDDASAGRSTIKSSENMSNLIESSIYCAKVKELRMKINDELLAIMTSLESENVSALEPQELRRMCKRSAEFSGRFQRIHLYQLQRQMHDLKRHSSLSLPFAKHTQFQSQMTRIVALHQNMLQAFQVFHKSFEQSACLRESGEQLVALAQAARDAGSLCAQCAAPPRCAAARELYCDELNGTCDKLELAVRAYSGRVASCLVAVDTSRTSTTRSKKSSESKKPSGKKGIGKIAKNAASMASAVAATSARLSMYSLDTLRLNVPGAVSQNNTSGGTSKVRVSSIASKVLVASDTRGQLTPKGKHKKSPHSSSRRPLMRAPREARPRRRAPKDSEIKTMVEAVDVPSSQISREASPGADLQSYNVTPRHGDFSPAGGAGGAPAAPATPGRHVARSPRAHRIPAAAAGPSRSPRGRPAPAGAPGLQGPRARAPAPRPGHTTFRGDTHDAEHTLDHPPLSPVSHIRCSERAREPEPLGERRGAEGRPEQSASTRDMTPPSGRGERERETAEPSPGGCEVTRLLRQLCGGDATGNRSERATGAKNAQLLCVNGGSPRQPSTPQLLRILEETIQKKVPKPMFQKPKVKDADRLRLTFNIAPTTTDNLLQYRTKFVQHMLTSSMYANSAVGKPWEMIGSVSEEIIAELLSRCAREMEIQHIVQELYECETK